VSGHSPASHSGHVDAGEIPPSPRCPLCWCISLAWNLSGRAGEKYISSPAGSWTSVAQPMLWSLYWPWYFWEPEFEPGYWITGKNTTIFISWGRFRCVITMLLPSTVDSLNAHAWGLFKTLLAVHGIERRIFELSTGILLHVRNVWCYVHYCYEKFLKFKVTYNHELKLVCVTKYVPLRMTL
jgi:hypothetical protein